MKYFVALSRMGTSLNVPERAAFLPFFPYSPLMYPDTPAGDCVKNHPKCRPFRSLRELSDANRGLDKAFARSRASAPQTQTTQYQARFALLINSSLFSFGYGFARLRTPMYAPLRLPRASRLSRDCLTGKK